MSRSSRLVIILAVGATAIALALVLPWPTAVSVGPTWLRGAVRSESTGEPMAGVWIMSREQVTRTDSLGHFALTLDSLPDTALVYARGYLSVRMPVTHHHAESKEVNVRLRRAPLRPSPLDGAWRARFTLDRPAKDRPPPSSSIVTGYIAFADTVPNPSVRGIEDSTDLYGRVHIDFTPFLGGPIAPFRDSRTIFGPAGPEILTEVEARVFPSDSFWMDLVPRITHGPISMRGEIQGDTARGTWHEREFCCIRYDDTKCCGAVGRFTLTRTH